jgi:hypothetical protein
MKYFPFQSPHVFGEGRSKRKIFVGREAGAI